MVDIEPEEGSEGAKHPERIAFEKALEENPLDNVLRLAFADWLDENDEVEEAARQRGWRSAYDWMADFCARTDYDFYEYRGIGEPNEDGEYDNYDYRDKIFKVPPPDRVLELAEYCADSTLGEGHICFGHDDGPQEARNDQDGFYDALEVLTGKKIDRPTRKNVTFSCAC